VPNLVSLGFLSTVATNGAPAAELRTDANTRARIREIGMFIGSATGSQYGIGRPAARGVTPTAPKDFLPYDVGDLFISGAFQSAVAWGTAPTIPSDFFRRIALPGTVGAGVILTFDDLIIPASGSIVFWNLTASAAILNLYVVAEI
jgi:hypothetical protein